MDVELERDILGRITGVVAARLIVQLPVHSEVAGARSMCCAELGFHGERFGIDVQLLGWIKRKSDVFTLRIDDASGGKVTWRFQLERRGNQEFRFRTIRVDVESIFHSKIQLDIGRLTGRDRRGGSAFESDVDA